MASGLSHLRFRCTSCGNCCRDLSVPLTDADLQRLLRKTSRSASQVVSWVASEHVDLIGEPGSLVVLGTLSTRVLMILARTDEGCRFLGADAQCTVYEARPASCRLFPFDPSFGRRGGVRRLRLLSGTECAHERTGHNDAHALREADLQRWAEQRAYQAKISAWNRMQLHRSRLGRRLRDAPDFLAFLGFGESAEFA